MSVVKEGWTYKTFGEVGSFLRGKSIQKADFVEKGLPCIHYGQIHTKFGISVEKHLSEIPVEIYEKSIIASPGDVIIAITSEDLDGSCKSTAWLGSYDVAVSAHAAVFKHNLNPKFIAYYLRSNSFYSEKGKYARGFKVMEIKTTDIARIPLPVPPLPTQQSIVSELDKINELIALKKSQLKDLDFLAQSIFYEMFGDPVTNEKGWEVKKWNQLFDTKLGKMLDKAKQNSEARIYPYLANFNIQWGSFDLSDLRQMPFTDNEIEKYKLKKGDLMICEGGESGRCAIWPGSDSIILFQKAVHRARIKDNSAVDIMYIKFFMEYAKKGGGLKDYISKSTIEHLTGEKLNMVPIPLPPLSLQLQFAERVEAIERMKQQVQTAIKDLETLLASRMQYWFD